MWAISKSTGECFWGEMMGDNFVVQTGAPFDPKLEVFVLDQQLELKGLGPIGQDLQVR